MSVLVLFQHTFDIVNEEFVEESFISVLQLCAELVSINIRSQLVVSLCGTEQLCFNIQNNSGQQASNMKTISFSFREGGTLV